MAKKTTVVVICDECTAEGAEHWTLESEGRRAEVDLCADHSTYLKEILERYGGRGRKVTTRAHIAAKRHTR